jgi:hypothetical protein
MIIIIIITCPEKNGENYSNYNSYGRKAMSGCDSHRLLELVNIQIINYAPPRYILRVYGLLFLSLSFDLLPVFCLTGLAFGVCFLENK